MTAAAAAAAAAASAAQEASRKMTEEAQQHRVDMKRWMEEMEEQRSMRSSQRSSAKGSKTAPSVESALTERRKNKVTTEELLRKITPKENAVVDLAGNPIRDFCEQPGRSGNDVAGPMDVAADGMGKARPVADESEGGGRTK